MGISPFCHKKVKPDINNNNNWFLYSALPIKINVLHSVLLPRSLDSLNSALTVHFLYSLRSIPVSTQFTCQLNHNYFHILLGPHLYTWVERSNVDKVLCWRTTELGNGGNRTLALTMKVERSHQCTMITSQVSMIEPTHNQNLNSIKM